MLGCCYHSSVLWKETSSLPPGQCDQNQVPKLVPMLSLLPRLPPWVAWGFAGIKKPWQGLHHFGWPLQDQRCCLQRRLPRQNLFWPNGDQVHISKSNSFVVLKYVIDTLLEIEMRSWHNDWLRERERESWVVANWLQLKITSNANRHRGWNRLVLANTWHR